MLFTLGGFFKSIISLFKTRVLSVGGNFEAETNLENQLNALGSTLFDSASLIITPNAYKEQTLYSIKPDKIGNNSLLWSEQFDNSYWYKVRCSIVSNQEIAPDGSLTADYVVEDSTTGLRYIGRMGIPTSIGQTYTFSVFVKKKDRSQIMLQIGEGNSLYPTVVFDFDSQVFTQTTPLLTSSFQSVGNGWFRIILTRTPTTGTSSIIGIFPINVNGQYSGTGDGVSRTIIWGAQLELGSTATDYISTTDRAIVNGTIGDLTVTRATTATRVNQQGLIELVPYNLFSYSEDFGNSFWTKNNATVTTNTNQTMSPIGTNTVDLYVPNTTLAEHPFNPVFSSSNSSLYINSTNIYNWSIYVKSAGNNFFLLRVNINGTWSSVVFNLSSSSIVSTHPNFISANIENVGNGWRLISCVFSGVNGINIFQHISSPTGDTYFSGDGTSGAYIWGAQLTLGTSKREYFATTDRLNVARIDYTTGSPAILVEPQRTNLALKSNTFSDAGFWAKTNVTANDNNGIGIDGNLSASLITTSSTANFLFQVFTCLPNTTYTFTFYVKRGTMTDLKYRFRDQTNNIDVIPVTSYYSQTNSTTFTRITVTLTTPDGCTSFRFSPIADTGSIGTCYITSAQIEVGSNATSYIPTTTSSVTRNADVISKSGISSLIGQTEGSVYLEVPLVDLKSNGRNFITLFFNSSNWVRFRIQTESLSNINIQTEWYVNAVFVNQGNANIPRSTSLNKILFTYKIGSQVNFFHNGVKLISTNPIITQIPPFNQINLGANQVQGSQIDEGIKIAALWKTQLTDQQAIQLTTL